MQLSVKSDLKELSKHLTKVQKKQIPFAAKNALTDTVKDGRVVAKREMHKRLDRPTPWTVRGVLYEGAQSKSKLQASVYISDDRYRYLRWQIEGGTRKPRKKALLVPVNVSLNKYGNMTRRKVASLRNKSNVFSGNVGGVGGIYKRHKRADPKLLVAYSDQIKYGVKYPFGKIVVGSYRRNFPKHYRKRLSDALRTAK